MINFFKAINTKRAVVLEISNSGKKPTTCEVVS